MTLSAPGIGHWPAPRPHMGTCRHCGDVYAAGPGSKYCPRTVCQAAKARRCEELKLQSQAAVAAAERRRGE